MINCNGSPITDQYNIFTNYMYKVTIIYQTYLVIKGQPSVHEGLYLKITQMRIFTLNLIHPVSKLFKSFPNSWSRIENDRL